MQEHNITVKIEGMSCGHCVKTVRNALEDAKGVEVVDVEIGSATIILDKGLTDLGAVADAIDETGFEVLRSAVE